jgi:hippurate hydrolase
VAEQWRALGAEVTEGVGGHGVVGLIRNGQGPTLMLRTDLDALPVKEETSLVYASSVTTTDDSGDEVSVMHACGHDVHMTNLIGVARFLASHRDAWHGTLLLVGQPAEERGSGAKAMLDDGLFTRFPKPDFALALHVAPNLPAGKIAYRQGYSLANVDSVDILIKGVGGHGAYPHMTVDPIVQAAELIVSLQTVVSREVDPVDSAVVTVGSVHGGTKHNVIPGECRLQLTVRSYSPEVRKHVLEAIERKARAAAQGARAPEPEVTVSEGTPAVYNDPELVQRIVPALQSALGEGNVVQAPPTMGGEDFSQYGLAGVPSLMFWLGSVEGTRLARFAQLGQTPPSLHSPLYYPDVEPTLAAGINGMLAAALEILGTRSGE